MIFEEKQIKLKDGTLAVFKTPELSDAAKMLNYIKTACGETVFLLRYPEEYEPVTLEKEEKWVSNLRASKNSLDIACYVNGEVAGNCEISFYTSIKTRHRATVAIAILQKYWGHGIGSAMFEELIAAAKAHGTEIIDLEFVEGNNRARSLYEKYGFKVICEKPNAFKLKDGTYRSEFHMQKYLIGDKENEKN